MNFAARRSAAGRLPCRRRASIRISVDSCDKEPPGYLAAYELTTWRASGASPLVTARRAWSIIDTSSSSVDDLAGDGPFARTPRVVSGPSSIVRVGSAETVDAVVGSAGWAGNAAGVETPVSSA